MTEPVRTTIEVGDGAAIPRPEDKGLVSAWWLALIGAVALIVLLPWLKPDPYLNILRFVPDGILITFEVTVFSISLAIVIGLLTGLGRLSRNRFINLIASLYVEVVRGIPLLVQLFYIYYALGRFVRVPDLVAAVIAMAFCYGAYMGEVFRAGIELLRLALRDSGSPWTGALETVCATLPPLRGDEVEAVRGQELLAGGFPAGSSAPSAGSVPRVTTRSPASRRSWNARARSPGVLCSGTIRIFQISLADRQAQFAWATTNWLNCTKPENLNFTT